MDFGSQYTQLIARRVRELNVYCEIHPYNNLPPLVHNVKGVILSGGPNSVLDNDAPQLDLSGIRNNIPVLGVCYGAQLIANQNGGKVSPSQHREYGRARLSRVDAHDHLMKEMSLNSQVWMSHADTITSLSDHYQVIASTNDVEVAAFKIADISPMNS